MVKVMFDQILTGPYCIIINCTYCMVHNVHCVGKTDRPRTKIWPGWRKTRTISPLATLHPGKMKIKNIRHIKYNVYCFIIIFNWLGINTVLKDNLLQCSCHYSDYDPVGNFLLEIGLMYMVLPRNDGYRRLTDLMHIS